MEPILQAIEKKGATPLSFATQFIDPQIATAQTGSAKNIGGVAELPVHLPNSNSTMNIRISPSGPDGERKVELTHHSMDGKSMKEMVEIVVDVMKGSNLIANRVAAGETQNMDTAPARKAEIMSAVSIDTSKSGQAVKGALDLSLANAFNKAQVSENHLAAKEQPQAAHSAPAPHK